jgi:hypothetical protein
MKALRMQLEAAGLVTTSLTQLYKVGGEVAFRLTVSGEDDDAEDLWENLRPLVEATGYWPIILGDSDGLERVVEQATDKTWGKTKTLIEKSQAINGEEFLAGQFEEFLSYRQEDLAYARQRGDEDRVRELETALASDDPFRCMPRGKWPRSVRPSNRLVTPYDHGTGEHLPEVFVALVPTKVSWQAPIYLHFGGFNDCPHPDSIGAVLRHWEQKYGAETICVTGDVLELRVANPPTKRATALALAREQFLFSRDIVEQGTETIDHLAAELLNAQTWFFWWD